MEHGSCWFWFWSGISRIGRIRKSRRRTSDKKKGEEYVSMRVSVSVEGTECT